MHEAQFHSETHKIPVLDFQEKTTDCKSVYNDIINFLDSNNVSKAQQHSPKLKT